jgi:dihydrofolate synthase / folylpolyglutamate synthase
MTYQETLDYLYSCLPIFQRDGASAYKKDITNTLALCEFLGNPQKKFKSIHVAGTNGKGSTSHAIASVLQEEGYKTGLYTSPHLKNFTERIKLNGKEVNEEWIVNFVEKTKNFIEKIQPSFFEVTVGMAFQYFAENEIDLAVIEVGMGGRLDSTNVIDPILSIITNISYDHQFYLGDTLPLIAGEKAGIIKVNTPVIISQFQEEVAAIFLNKSKSLNAPIYFAEKDLEINFKNKERDEVILSDKISFDVKSTTGLFELTDLEFGLSGNYQVHNIPGIIKSYLILKELGFSISEKSLRQGLKNIIQNTSLKGRWQILRRSPLVVCDTGHNEEGIRFIVSQLSKINYKKLFFILGVVNDKKLDPIFKILPKDAYYYFSQASIPRALPAHELYEQGKKFGLQGEIEQSVNKAYQIALEKAGNEDLIFIGGSTFTVAELDDL